MYCVEDVCLCQPFQRLAGITPLKEFLGKAPVTSNSYLIKEDTLYWIVASRAKVTASMTNLPARTCTNNIFTFLHKTLSNLICKLVVNIVNKSTLKWTLNRDLILTQQQPPVSRDTQDLKKHQRTTVS